MMKKKQIIKTLEDEIARLKQVQQIWAAKKIIDCAHNLQWEIFGIEFALKQLRS